MDVPSKLLVEASLRGDREALGALLGRHLPSLRSYVDVRFGPVLRSKESPSDVVQSVCRELLEDLDEFRFESEGKFRHWLFQQAERKLVDHARAWRAKRRDVAREEPLLADDGDDSADRVPAAAGRSPSQAAQAREDADQLAAALRRLPDDHREVIVLARIVGLTHAEIAERMDRSALAVRVLLCRALARLTSLLPAES